MPLLKTISAALTILIGCLLFAATARVDYPLADGDGGFLTPGLLLAIILGGAPIITGVSALKGLRALTGLGRWDRPEPSAGEPTERIVGTGDADDEPVADDGGDETAPPRRGRGPSAQGE